MISSTLFFFFFILLKSNSTRELFLMKSNFNVILFYLYYGNPMLGESCWKQLWEDDWDNVFFSPLKLFPCSELGGTGLYLIRWPKSITIHEKILYRETGSGNLNYNVVYFLLPWQFCTPLELVAYLYPISNHLLNHLELIHWGQRVLGMVLSETCWNNDVMYFEEM
jgi:hypothetical protein